MPVIPAPQSGTVWTALVKNGEAHVTDPLAVKVVIYIHEPKGGPERARPTINGTPIRGGGGPYEIVAQPGYNVAPITIKTRAGNNDVVIVEEF